MTRRFILPEVAQVAQGANKITVKTTATRLPKAEEKPNLEAVREAIQEAGDRELARGHDGPYQLIRMIGMTAVAAITQASRLSSPEVHSALESAAVEQGPFADLSFQQCLDLMIVLARIIKDKEAEADSH